MSEPVHISQVIKQIFESIMALPDSQKEDFVRNLKHNIREKFDKGDMQQATAAIENCAAWGLKDFAEEMINDLRVEVANNRTKEDAIKETYPAKERIKI